MLPLKLKALPAQQCEPSSRPAEAYLQQQLAPQLSKLAVIVPSVHVLHTSAARFCCTLLLPFEYMQRCCSTCLQVPWQQRLIWIHCAQVSGVIGPCALALYALNYSKIPFITALVGLFGYNLSEQLPVSFCPTSSVWHLIGTMHVTLGSLFMLFAAMYLLCHLLTSEAPYQARLCSFMPVFSSLK